MISLHPYQVPAVDMIASSGRLLLAMDLGTGKTVTAIAAMERLMSEGKVCAPVLVFTLSGLKYQWAAEVSKFTDSRALVVDGPPAKRAQQYAEARDWRSTGVDYVVLNYEQAVNDWDEVSSLEFGAVVADEASVLRSFRAKRAKAVKKLSRRVPVRVALTGTPVENGKPEELYGVMDFVDPKVLGSFYDFDRRYIVRTPWGSAGSYRNLGHLHERVAPHVYRKRQSDPDVAPYLPAVVDGDPILVPMDRRTRELYDRIAADLMESLDEATDLFGGSFSWSLEALYGGKEEHDPVADEVRGRIMSRFTALRMLCDHPDLLRISASRFLESMEGVGSSGSAYIASLNDQGLLDGINSAPKLDALVSYADRHLQESPEHKLVVFTAYVPSLGIIQDALRWDSVSYSGALSAKAKERAKRTFQTDPGCRVLISSDAGGFGMDLPQANALVNFGLPWTAGAAVQRNSRIIRASSRWPSVRVDRLLVAGSVEERQHQMLTHKASVARAVVDGRGINVRGGVDTSVSGLKDFLTRIPATG